MEQKDRLMTEIERLSIFLKKIMANFIKINADQNEAAALEHINNQFLSELNFNFNDFLNLPNNQAIETLNNLNLNPDQLEILANFVTDMAQITKNNPKINTNVAQKAILLLEACNLQSKTFSWERNNQINQLKSLS